jgi:hypothetical protein
MTLPAGIDPDVGLQGGGLHMELTLKVALLPLEFEAITVGGSHIRCFPDEILSCVGKLVDGESAGVCAASHPVTMSRAVVTPKSRAKRRCDAFNGPSLFEQQRVKRGRPPNVMLAQDSPFEHNHAATSFVAITSLGDRLMK